MPPDDSLPPVQVPPDSFFGQNFERKEQTALEKSQDRNHTIRGWVAYGAMIVALLMYIGGVMSIGVVLGVIPGVPKFDLDKWHVVVAIVAALFTVPTVLVLAVLKSSTPVGKDDSTPDSVHEAVANAISKLIDKVADLIAR